MPRDTTEGTPRPDPAAALVHIEWEVDQLRCRCRWLQAGTVAGLALSAACIAVVVTARRDAAPKAPDHPAGSAVEADRFVLRGADGKPRAVLGFNAGGQACLTLSGNKGAAAVIGFQESEADFPYVLLSDTQGRRRLTLTVSDDRAELDLLDPRGESAATVQQSFEGGGTLSLAKRPGRGHVEAGVHSDGSPFLSVTGARTARSGRCRPCPCA